MTRFTKVKTLSGVVPLVSQWMFPPNFLVLYVYRLYVCTPKIEIPITPLVSNVE